MKKILIVGGYGFVGGCLAELAARSWQVSVCGRQHKAGLAEEIKDYIVDATDQEAMQNFIDEIQPDAVVNTAAISNIDYAETHHEETLRINVRAAATIADACARCNARYVYLSSDAVYDGANKSYSEDSQLAPVNYYGISKMLAETAIFKAAPEAVIIRISLVLGLPITAGNSLLAGLRAKLDGNENIPCPLDEIRTPVDVQTLSESILELLTIGFSGVIHIAATECINRFELSMRLASQFGHPVEKIVPFNPDQQTQIRAPRHKNGIISVAKAQRILQTGMLSIEDTILRSIKSNRYRCND